MIVLVITFLPIAADHCPDSFFYDQVIDRCEQCASICHYAEIQGTMAECRVFCPDYRQADDGVNEAKGKSSGEEEDNKDDHHVLLIPVLIGVGICLGVCLVVIGIHFRERCAKDARSKRGYNTSDHINTTHVKINLIKVTEPMLPQLPPEYPGPRLV